MSFYEDKVLPHLINCACGQKPIREQREKLLPLAKAKVLEVGMGSGLNLEFYDPSQVEMIWGLEPSEGMRRKAAPVIEKSGLPVEWLGLPGEQIPLDDNSADTIVLTYTLCTIADAPKALAEMRRVLKPEGTLLFCEHGEAPDDSVQKWQKRVNPMWGKVFGGCNLNRPIPDLIGSAGFNIGKLEQKYLPGPKIVGYNYWGFAQ